MSNIGVITEQGDLGLGFNEVKEELPVITSTDNIPDEILNNFEGCKDDNK